MSARYEPLKTIVSYFCDQYQKSSGDFDRYWVLAFRGLSYLHYNISAEPKTVRLVVDANQTVRFPNDYVQWVKIGLENSNGEISTLRVNNALTTFNSTNPDRLSNLTPDIASALTTGNQIPFLNFFNNGEYETRFGVGYAGIQTYGECRVDDKNNVIILSPNFAYKSILVEYISAPERDTEYMVDVRLREAIIAWIAWQLKLDSRQNFYGFAIDARRTIKPLNMQSFNQTIRLNEKMTLNV